MRIFKASYIFFSLVRKLNTFVKIFWLIIITTEIEKTNKDIICVLSATILFEKTDKQEIKKREKRTKIVTKNFIPFFEMTENLGGTSHFRDGLKNKNETLFYLA